jgi:hypothetical protein
MCTGARELAPPITGIYTGISIFYDFIIIIIMWAQARAFSHHRSPVSIPVSLFVIIYYYYYLGTVVGVLAPPITHTGISPDIPTGISVFSFFQRFLESSGFADANTPQCQKRPITVSKEIYYSVKRDLFTPH